MTISEKAGCYFLRMLMGAWLLLSVACVHPASSESKAVGGTFKAPKDKALVYVYRMPSARAVISNRPVFIDDRHVGSNRNGTFMAIPLRPGTYRVQAAGFVLPYNAELKKVYPELKLKVQAGKTYFIRQTVEGSLMGIPSSTSGQVTMIQTGGTPIPTMGGGWPPYYARLVDESTGRAECVTFRQVEAQPVP